MIACLCRAMRLDQDEETIYADFNADVYNDLIEYQFNKIVELMSGLGTGESILILNSQTTLHNLHQFFMQKLFKSKVVI